MLETFYTAIEDLSESKSGFFGTLYKGLKELIGLGGSSKSYMTQSRESTTKDTSAFSFTPDEKIWLQVNNHFWAII
jgi:hypothetical protein